MLERVASMHLFTVLDRFKHNFAIIVVVPGGLNAIVLIRCPADALAWSGQVTLCLSLSLCPVVIVIDIQKIAFRNKLQLFL